MYVFTVKHTLLIFKYGSNAENPVSDLTQVAKVDEVGMSESQLVDMSYVQELSALVLAFDCGEIYQYNTETKKVEEVGGIDSDIIAAKWAPNEEYYAIASSEGELYLFTPEWDVLYRVPLDDDDSTWSAGEAPPDDLLVEQACISWKGDSNLLQVNYQINNGFKCLTRDVQAGLTVFKGPARADNNFVFSVSESPLVNMHRPICFLPNGSLSAGY